MIEHILKRLIKKGGVFNEQSHKLKVRLLDGFESSLSEEDSKFLSANKSEILKILNGDIWMDVSPSQERIWFLDQIGKSAGYHIASIFKIDGVLNVGLLESSIDELVARHASFRAVFKTLEDSPIQIIKRHHRFKIVYLEATSRDEKEKRVERQAIFRKHQSDKFDLEGGPLLRVTLVKSTSTEHYLGICMHHIISDGWSLGIWSKELSEIYKAKLGGNLGNLPISNVQYTDYVAWCKSQLATKLLKDDLTYWENQLKGYKDLELYTDYPRPLEQSENGGEILLKISPSIGQELKKMCMQKRVTLLSALLAGLYIVLSKYSGQVDICIGLPVANRDQEEFKNVIGLFVNTITIRINTTGGYQTVEQLVFHIQKLLIDGQKHQQVPFDKIVHHIGSSRDLSKSPIFQVLANFSKQVIGEAKLGDAIISSVPGERNASRFDLSFDFLEKTDANVVISVTYSKDIFKRSTIESLGNHFEKALGSMIKVWNQDVNFVNLLSLEEEQKLESWNRTERRYDESKSLIALFKDRVVKNSEKVALCFKNEKFTYRQLDNASDWLADHLKELGVGPNVIVGLCTQRSFEMIVGIFAILKAGGAYLPIDPQYPNERIKYLKEDSALTIVLTQDRFQEKLKAALDESLVSLISISIENKDKSNINNETRIDLDSVAYVIYTSGSTGHPKGVAISHGALLNRLLWMQERYPLNSTDVILQKTPFTFDVSVWELLWWSISGSSLYILEPDNEKYPIEIVRAIVEARVTTLHFVPSMLNAFLEYIRGNDEESKLVDLKRVFSSGEALMPQSVIDFYRLLPQASLTNLYGPTEATIDVSYYDCDPSFSSEMVPIGYPIANTTLHILDDKGMKLPIGIPGELHIGGKGLANGYLNRESLTQEKFIYINGNRLYKTGDLARWLTDGAIEFIGRIDQQIKIRGYRIELEEIESVIRQHPFIVDAIVVKRSIYGYDHLIGFYVLSPELSHLEVNELRKLLLTKLPEYMVPSYFQHLAQLPLTSSGKANRKLLLSQPLDIPLINNSSDLKNDIEIKVSKVWQDILGIETIGLDSNFFEIGGHSLIAIKIMTRLNSEFQLYLHIKEIFNHSTVRSLSQLIKTSALATQKKKYTPSNQTSSPLSYSQERLWFLAQTGQNREYNLYNIISLTGAFNIDAFERAVKYLVERHASFRTSFEMYQEGPIQVVAANILLPVELIDLSNRNCDLDKELESLITTPFDLSKPSLIAIKLIKLKEDIHIVGVCMHHIISDAWSLDIFVRELESLYISYKAGLLPWLEPLHFNYIDYSIQQRIVESKDYERSLLFWKNELRGYSNLNLPFDFERPEALSSIGGTSLFKIDYSVISKLNKYCGEKRVTLFSCLMASIYILMERYSGQRDFCIGVPVANRDEEIYHSVIGFFVNTLAIRIKNEQPCTVDELVRGIQESIVNGQMHQRVPFDKVVKLAEARRELKFSPLFQILANYSKLSDEKRAFADLALEEIDPKISFSRLDLAFDFIETRQEELFIKLSYNKDVFLEKTIKGLGEHLVNIVKALPNYSDQLFHSIDFITEDEKGQIQTWNDTPQKFPEDKGVHHLFKDQAIKLPDNVAVQFNDSTISYQKLDELSDEYALSLRESYTSLNTVVGICFERSIEMIVAILAVLKSGAAYLPIEPNYPLDRKRFMVKDSEASIIITQQKLCESLQSIAARLVVLTIDAEVEPIHYPEHKRSSTFNSDQLAYIIYTSGTTGQPKGVMIRHSSCVNMVWESIRRMEINPEDAVSQFASLCFDVSVKEIFISLLSGAKLVIIPEQARNDRILYLEYVKQHQVSVALMPPPFISSLEQPEDLKLRVLVTGGESSNLADARFYASKMDYYNEYGPTEIGVCATYYKMNRDHAEEFVPIGRPIANTSLHILNEGLVQQPIGVAGELYISGKGVALGYINRLELTNEKFLANPFDQPNKMYKTGDLARWLPDGNVEFLGRKDNQVKLRGYRIELEEIESVLQSHPHIIHAAVIVSKIGHDNNLVAYFTSKVSDTSIDLLKSFLSERLPNYMVPKVIVQLQEIPLTNNLKIDRYKLAENQIDSLLSSVRQLPTTKTEELLCSIWKDVLKQEVGVEDNFFDIGGDSISSILVANKINRHLGINLTVVQLFTHQTISALSKWIGELQKAKEEKISPVPKAEYYDLSFAQRRFWVMDRMGEKLKGNITGISVIEEILDLDAFTKAYQACIERHEILRTTFYFVMGVPKQYVNETDKVKIDLRMEDLTHRYDWRDRALAAREKEMSTPFNLEVGPLLKFLFLKIEERKYVSVFTAHHIIMDGWSMKIFTDELFGFYLAAIENQGKQLPPLVIQYKDYSAWHNTKITGEFGVKALTYWKSKFLGRISSFNFPSDFQRKQNVVAEGKRIFKSLGKEIHSGLAQINDASLFAKLLSIISIGLHKRTQNNCIIVRVPFHGRERDELQNQIGLYINSLPIKIEIPSEATFSDVLTVAKNTLTSAFEFQDYPVDELSEKLKLEREYNKVPFSNVVVVMQSKAFTPLPGDKGLNLPKPEKLAEMANTVISTVDLRIELNELEDDTVIVVDFNANLFKLDTMESLINQFATIAEMVITNHEILIGNIDITRTQFPPFPKETVIDSTFAFNF